MSLILTSLLLSIVSETACVISTIEDRSVEPRVSLSESMILWLDVVCSTTGGVGGGGGGGDEGGVRGEMSSGDVEDEIGIAGDNGGEIEGTVLVIGGRGGGVDGKRLGDKECAMGTTGNDSVVNEVRELLSFRMLGAELSFECFDLR